VVLGTLGTADDQQFVLVGHLDDRAAVRLMERMGEADYRITEGANEQVQLEALLASLALDA
jgi:DNA polymerase III delta prime subunit